MWQWRPFTWLILVLNALMAAWFVSEFRTGPDCVDAGYEALCQAGVGLGAAFIVLLWALGNVILGVLWLVTRTPRRLCWVCGFELKAAATRCRSCGYDFQAEASGQRQSLPPQRNLPAVVPRRRWAVWAAFGLVALSIGAVAGYLSTK